MNINNDFSKSVLIDTSSQRWLASPMKGVERKPLDRIGDEVARATSIVKYGPNSCFSRHVHTGGEEFLVLEGIFQDEHGDYPAGTYVRNPPMTAHSPFSNEGCVILVKLWQFELSDRFQTTVNINELLDKSAETTEFHYLYKSNKEKVAVLCLRAGETYPFIKHKGLELYVVQGAGNLSSIEATGSEPPVQSISEACWFRQSIGSSVSIEAKTTMIIWLKIDHFLNLQKQIENLHIQASK